METQKTKQKTIKGDQSNWDAKIEGDQLNCNTKIEGFQSNCKAKIEGYQSNCDATIKEHQLNCNATIEGYQSNWATEMKQMIIKDMKITDDKKLTNEIAKFSKDRDYEDCTLTNFIKWIKKEMKE